MSRALSRRVEALEALAPAGPDHERDALAGALARLGRGGELDAKLASCRAGGGILAAMGDPDPAFDALVMRLWMEGRGWTYVPGDERP